MEWAFCGQSPISLSEWRGSGGKDGQEARGKGGWTSLVSCSGQRVEEHCQAGLCGSLIYEVALMIVLDQVTQDDCEDEL